MCDDFFLVEWTKPSDKMTAMVVTSFNNFPQELSKESVKLNHEMKEIFNIAIILAYISCK